MKIKSWPVLLCVFAMKALLAASYLTITKSPNYFFPDQIVLNAQGAGDYIVTNNTSVDRDFDVRNVLPQVERLPAIGEADDCGTAETIHLDAGASCTLRLGFTPTAIQDKTYDHLLTVCVKGASSQYCANTPLTEIIAAVAPSDQTDLSIEQKQLNFSSGEESQWVIKNTGTYVANNVRLVFPANFVQYIDDSSNTICPSVEPGASCLMKIKMKSDFPNQNMDSSVYLQGGNTQAQYQSYLSKATLLYVSHLLFDKPGEASILIRNNGNKTISGLQMQPVSELQNIVGLTYDANASTCVTTFDGVLKPGDSCVFKYKVTQDSHGQDPIKVTFTPQGSVQKSINSFVAIPRPKVAINPNSSDITQPIKINPNVQTTVVTIKNTEPFSVVNPEVSLSSSQGLVSVDANFSGGCSAAGLSATGGKLEQGQSCQIHLIKNQHFAESSDASCILLQMNADNMSSSETTVSSSTGVNICPDTSDEHMQYLPFTLTNNTGSDISLANMTITAPVTQTTNVDWCGASGASCSNSYISNQCSTTTDLADGDSCQLWFEAKDSDTLSAATKLSFTVDLGVQSIDGQTIYFNYGNALFVGGDFDLSSDANDPGNYIAKYDTSWSSVASGSGNGPTGVVKALKIYNGDLYMGGEFSSISGDSTMSLIARWDGASWHSLDSGITSTSDDTFKVEALGTHDSRLVVGGHFTKQISGLNNTSVINWDGSSWHAYNQGLLFPLGVNVEVDSIGSYDSQLVVGGNFTNGDGQCYAVDDLFYLAKWDGTDFCWKPIVQENNNSTYQDVNNTVRTIHEFNDKLFIGGDFSYAVGYTDSNALYQHYEPALALNLGNTTGSYVATAAGYNAVYEPSKSPGWMTWATTTAGTAFNADSSVYTAEGTSTSIGLIYVGGSFNSVSTGAVNFNSASKLAVTSLEDFVDPIDSTEFNGTVEAMTFFNDKLYFAGDFSSPYNHIAYYQVTGTTGYHDLGEGISTGNVYALQKAAYLSYADS